MRASSLKYEAYDYFRCEIMPLTADVAVMNGRARLRVSTGGQRLEVIVQFLIVWKKEAGAWHLFAHQSSRLPASFTEGAPKPK